MTLSVKSMPFSQNWQSWGPAASVIGKADSHACWKRARSNQGGQTLSYYFPEDGRRFSISLMDWFLQAKWCTRQRLWVAYPWMLWESLCHKNHKVMEVAINCHLMLVLVMARSPMHVVGSCFYLHPKHWHLFLNHHCIASHHDPPNEVLPLCSLSFLQAFKGSVERNKGAVPVALWLIINMFLVLLLQASCMQPSALQSLCPCLLVTTGFLPVSGWHRQTSPSLPSKDTFNSAKNKSRPGCKQWSTHGMVTCTP